MESFSSPACGGIGSSHFRDIAYPEGLHQKTLRVFVFAAHQIVGTDAGGQLMGEFLPNDRTASDDVTGNNQLHTAILLPPESSPNPLDEIENAAMPRLIKRLSAGT